VVGRGGTFKISSGGAALSKLAPWWGGAALSKLAPWWGGAELFDWPRGDTSHVGALNQSSI